MAETSANRYWVFSNKPPGAYDGNVWDMETILATERYSFKETESNRRHVKPGDQVVLRVYGQSYVGRFHVAGPWTPFPDDQQQWPEVVVGAFPMADVQVWPRPVPQHLVMNQLSNQNFRRRVVRITSQDAAKIEMAQHVYERLGFGSADGQIVVLEKGLEEAIKPNLTKLGLRLAD